MSESCNILKRRSSSFTYSKKPDQSFDISRLSTAINSSQKGASPRSLNKYFYDSSNYYLLTENNSFQSKRLNGLSESISKHSKSFVTPKQLFTENSYNESKGKTQDRMSKNTLTYCDCCKHQTNNNKINKKMSEITKKAPMRSSSEAKGQQQSKNFPQQKKKNKVKKQVAQTEKKDLIKKIDRLATQIQAEEHLQKENEMNFILNVASIKAKIDQVQQQRKQSFSNSLNIHESAKNQLEQKTQEFYDLQKKFQSMYTGIVEKHNQDQVNWSLTYTNLLKDKSNLKKNILIKSKLR
ncbi:hypothetical protein TTHERM_00726430 (macronuclear) [Tetrahymena thermophila SB210]|uniref:Uncharacterized protein n=1 Tax=Tetrahymena thermophila (strain SB210) TaxID=312017 RepID=Q24GE8_TETTS|nr:hypothetical protein TTHERM_00726430 [Tetrahymena thermophila SB210]EAS06923.1 hypothetical protein TTHERM_00726430 [Tetrahymena thermophila SB210]|eukprot:XP_001027165.1 hypothetical protein TTHERM_00726430 [Tetrahymena thermophila SB210]